MLAEAIYKAGHLVSSQVVLSKGSQTPIGAPEGDLLLIFPLSEVLLEVVVEGASQFDQLPLLDVLLDPLVDRVGLVLKGLVSHDLRKLIRCYHFPLII